MPIRALPSNPASCLTACPPGVHIPATSFFLTGASSPDARAIFLDRDGVLIRDVHYLRTPSQIELMPHVGNLRALQDRFFLIVATNQSGIAREFFSEDDLCQIHGQLADRLASENIRIDAFYYCPHLETAAKEKYRADCLCRKPRPGLLQQAAADWGIELHRSYMIGDSPRDVEAGRVAGVAQSILLRNRNDALDGLDFRCAPDLAAALDIIQENEG